MMDSIFKAFVKEVVKTRIVFSGMLPIKEAVIGFILWDLIYLFPASLNRQKAVELLCISMCMNRHLG